MTYLYAGMFEVHRRWVEAPQVWLVIQVFWGTPQADCGSVRDWTVVLTTHGVVPQCRCRDVGWDICQTDDEIVSSPTFTRKCKINGELMSFLAFMDLIAYKVNILPFSSFSRPSFDRHLPLNFLHKNLQYFFYKITYHKCRSSERTFLYVIALRNSGLLLFILLN